MARKLPETPEIQRLIRLSEASRSCLATEAAALRHRLDVPSRIRGSLQAHPSAWLFGSLASGMAASLLFRRRPAKKKKHRGISGVLFGLILTTARPLAKVWLSGQLKHWASTASTGIRPARSTTHHPQSPPNVHSPGSGPR